MLAFFIFLSEVFLLHILCWLHFYRGSFCYTSRAGVGFLTFIWGVSLTHPMLYLLFCGEFLLHIPCWLLFFLFSWEFLLHIPCQIYFSVRSFSYTSIADFVFMWEVSLTHPVLPLFLSEEFLFHIPCWLLLFFFFFFFFFIGGVSLIRPVLGSFLSGVFLLHIPCWRLFFYLGSFSYISPVGFFFFFCLGSSSYTSHVGFTFLWGVFRTHPLPIHFYVGSSLTHPFLPSFLSEGFLLHIPCWLLFFIFYFNFIWGVCLTHPVLISFFIGRVSLTHSILGSFLSGEFLLYVPYWVNFYRGCFSYTSRAGVFLFI